MKNYSVDRKVWIPLKRTCLLAASATLFFIAGCGSKGVEEFGLDQKKIKDATIERAIQKVNTNEAGKYQEDDLVMTEVCKASLKESGNFSNKYFVFWKTKDGKEDMKDLINDKYEREMFSMNGYESYEVYNDECVSPE